MVSMYFLVGLGIAFSEKGWVFVVGRIYPAGHQRGQFYNNLPTSEPRNKSVVSNKITHSWPKKSSSSTSSESNDSAFKQFAATPTVKWPEKKRETSSTSSYEANYESTENGRGYRGSFSSSSFVIEDDGPVTDPFDNWSSKANISG